MYKDRLWQWMWKWAQLVCLQENAAYVGLTVNFKKTKALFLNCEPTSLVVLEEEIVAVQDCCYLESMISSPLDEDVGEGWHGAFSGNLTVCGSVFQPGNKAQTIWQSWTVSNALRDRVSAQLNQLIHQLILWPVHTTLWPELNDQTKCVIPQ